MVGRETLGGVNDKDLADEVLSHVRDLVPVRGGEVELSPFDDLEQFLVVFRVKRREATQPSRQSTPYKMYRMTPMLQKSTPLPYPPPFRISGATYPGVPHVVLIKSSPGLMKRARPKSEILMMEWGSLLA